MTKKNIKAFLKKDYFFIILIKYFDVWNLKNGGNIAFR